MSTTYVVTGVDTGIPRLPNDSVIVGHKIGDTFTTTLDPAVEAELIAAGLIAKSPVSSPVVLLPDGSLAAEDGRTPSGGSGSSLAGYPPAAGNNEFAQGSIAAGGSIAASASYPGGFAQGFATGAGSTISSTYAGAFAQGFASGGAITSSNSGSFAQGYAKPASGIVASEVGSFAQGYARDGAIITSSNAGSFAQGGAANGTITASRWGSFAQGYVLDGGAITSSHFGSFAQGGANGASSAITSSQSGSFAQGYAAAGETIAASAKNASQFGPGTNGQADSLQVGNGGIRLLGKAAAQPQTTLQNGDIWVADDGHVKVRSNGATVSL